MPVVLGAREMEGRVGEWAGWGQNIPVSVRNKVRNLDQSQLPLLVFILCPQFTTRTNPTKEASIATADCCKWLQALFLSNASIQKQSQIEIKPERCWTNLLTSSYKMDRRAFDLLSAHRGNSLPLIAPKYVPAQTNFLWQLIEIWTIWQGRPIHL